MSVTKEQILKSLSKVEDPDLKKDLVTLNMIQGVEIDGNKVSFEVVLTTPACPLKELIRKNCVDQITKDLGELDLDITMTSNVTTTRLSGANLLPEVKNIIAVASGKGGVGKSTVSTNLAISLAKEGASVGLIDADIFGPSIPTMFGCENEKPGVVEEDGKNKIMPLIKYGVKFISIGLLTPPDSAIVWRGPMASSALKQFFGDCDWGKLDYLIIDLPPGTSDIHLTMVQSIPVTGAVIVTTPQKVALADAQKGLAMFKQAQINVPILGIVENMAYFTPEELPDNKYHIFGKDGGRNFAEKNDVPFLGEIPIVQRIREAGDAGKPIVEEENAVVRESFLEISKTLARQVAIRNANFGKTKVVEMKI